MKTLGMLPILLPLSGIFLFVAGCAEVQKPEVCYGIRQSRSYISNKGPT
jgi:hypothetical protein